TPAASDQDHVRLLIDCNPAVPDRNAAVAGSGASPGPVLAEMARGLHRAGAEALVMPCNTAHAFKDAIIAATDLPFIDLIETAVVETMAQRPKVVGLLAADGCLGAELYQSALGRRGVEVRMPQPEAQARFMKALYRIKSGDVGAATRDAVREIAATLTAAGADVLLAGCTEVPLVLGPADLDW